MNRRSLSHQRIPSGIILAGGRIDAFNAGTHFRARVGGDDAAMAVVRSARGLRVDAARGDGCCLVRTMMAAVVLSHGAVITSLGLATWLPRQGQGIALCTIYFV